MLSKKLKKIAGQMQGKNARRVKADKDVYEMLNEMVSDLMKLAAFLEKDKGYKTQTHEDIIKVTTLLHNVEDDLHNEGWTIKI